MSSRYALVNSPDVALVAGVGKSVIGFLAPANSPFRIIEIGISFDGITATDVPVLVQLLAHDNTTPGTFSALSSFQEGGPARSIQGTGSQNFTVEPTDLDLVRSWRVRPDGGLVILQGPLGREIEQFRSNNGYVLRCNAPTNPVNAMAYFSIEEG